MALLSAVQIAEHAYRAGFRGQAVTTAVAVALAESNGDPHSHNPVPPDNSYGLWQVNMLGALGPERRHEFGLGSNDQLFNPDRNAHAAWEISNHGQSWTPWSTYTNGRYRDHLSAARHAEQVVSKHRGSAGGHNHVRGGAGRGGITVDPDRLHNYNRQVGRIGQGLSEVGAKIGQVRETIKTDTLGGIAGDGGFAAALHEFTDVFGSRIKLAGSACDHLGESVSRTGSAYRATDDHNRDDFTALRSV